MMFFAFIVTFDAFSLYMAILAFITKFEIIDLPLIVAWVAIIAVILNNLWKIIANQTDMICNFKLAIYACTTRTLNSVAISAFDFFYIFLNQFMDIFFSWLLLVILIMAFFARVNFVTYIANDVTISSHIVSANFI